MHSPSHYLTHPKPVGAASVHWSNVLAEAAVVVAVGDTDTQLSLMAQSGNSGGAGDVGAGNSIATSRESDTLQTTEQSARRAQEEQPCKQKEQPEQGCKDMASEASSRALEKGSKARDSEKSGNASPKAADKATKDATGKPNADETAKKPTERKYGKAAAEERRKAELRRKEEEQMKALRLARGEPEEEEEEKPFHFDGEHEYKGVIYPASVPLDILKRIKDFKFRKDDIVIAGYPKCGATWLEHATYLLLHAEKGETARNMHDLNQHAGFLEVRVPGGGVPVFLEVAEAMEGPRLIRTHLPHYLLHEQLAEAKPKVLFALRNPKDCLVSYFHFLRNNEDIFGFYGDFDAFFQLVREKRLTFGDWFDHVLGWWNLHDSDHVLFLEFEDMVKDLRVEVQNIVDFLEIDVTDEQIEEVTQLCYFKEMSKNPMTQLRIFPFLDADVKRYMRKGQVGDWKKHFSDEQNEYIDGIFKERLKGSSLEINFGDK